MKNLILFIFLLVGISLNAQTNAFSETFESANSLTLVNGTQTNKWFRGSANQCNGVSALYISNNSSAYAYTNTSASIVHAFFNVTIPVGATNIQLSFNRKIVGETTCSTCDYLQIWSLINSFTPTAGSLITASGTNRVLQGTISNSSICSPTSYTLPNTIAGTTRRIAFTWRNDNSAGSTPALIDNITVTYTPAPTPPSNDACSGATSLPCATSNLAGTTVATVSETPPGGIATSNFGVWYTFSGNGQQTTVSSTSTFDHEMAIFYGSSCGSLNLIISVDDAIANNAEQYTFVTVTGMTYWVWVAHYVAGSTITGTFTISRSCTTVANGPCNNSFAGPTMTMPTQSTPTVTSSCPTNGAFADEYLTLTGAVNATPYIVSSSRSADWITVRRTSSSGTVEASGTTPLSWTSSTTGTIYIHINANGACATIDGLCRDITVQRISSLPVELIYFDGIKYPTFNMLKWATASEHNSSHFSIERSIDGIEWKVIGTKTAAGNSNTQLNYSYLDAINQFTIHYYRLIQYDIDGQSKTYGPIILDNSNGIKKVVKYVNLAGQEVGPEYKGVIFEIYEDGTSKKIIR
jgi:hypothetical protein